METLRLHLLAIPYALICGVLGYFVVDDMTHHFTRNAYGLTPHQLEKLVPLTIAIMGVVAYFLFPRKDRNRPMPPRRYRLAIRVTSGARQGTDTSRRPPGAT